MTRHDILEKSLVLERALEYWTKYTPDTLPPQILAAVTDRMMREQREDREEQDGTADRRRTARLAAMEELRQSRVEYESSRQRLERRITQWEQLSPDNIGRQIYEAYIKLDLQSCQEETAHLSLRQAMVLHWEYWRR